MTRLVLVRHGDAGDPDPREYPDDMERPLTSKGVKRFKKAARGLGNLVTPERVLASPFARTLQTADLLHWDGGWPAHSSSLTLDDDHSPEQILDEIHGLKGKPKTVGLVGHGPSLAKLLHHLVDDHDHAPTDNDATVKNVADQDKPFELDRGGAALIETKGKKLQAGKGRLVWLLSEKELRAHRP